MQGQLDVAALSLAKLPLDRFVSVDSEMAGQLLTKPFEWKGEDLYINADAKWGEICARRFSALVTGRRSDALPLADVEIVDADTRRPFPGFWVPAATPPPYSDRNTNASRRVSSTNTMARLSSYRSASS